MNEASKRGLQGSPQSCLGNTLQPEPMAVPDLSPGTLIKSPVPLYPAPGSIISFMLREHLLPDCASHHLRWTCTSRLTPRSTSLRPSPSASVPEACSPPWPLKLLLPWPSQGAPLCTCRLSWARRCSVPGTVCGVEYVLSLRAGSER